MSLPKARVVRSRWQRLKATFSFRKLQPIWVGECSMAKAFIKLHRFAEDVLQSELDRAESKKPRPRSLAGRLVDILPQAPDGFMCRCGHRLNLHGRSHRDGDVVCFHKDCSCRVSETALEIAETPMDCFRPGPPQLTESEEARLKADKENLAGFVYGKPWPKHAMDVSKEEK